MSVPVIASPYRLGINPAWAAVNAITGQKIYGRLPSAPATASGPADIWPGAALQPIRALPTSTFQIAVSSDSANDILTSGSGAWTVLITYLDGGYASQTVQVNLNGLTAVTSISGVLRIQSAQVISAGSGGVNAGNIYVYDATSTLAAGIPVTVSKIYDMIPVGYNIDGLGMYTVPAGQQAAIMHVITNVTNGIATTYNARVRIGIALYSGNLGSGVLLPFQYAVIAGPSTGAPAIDLLSNLPDLLPPGSEIRFQASSTAAGAEVILIAELMQSTYPAKLTAGLI